MIFSQSSQEAAPKREMSWQEFFSYMAMLAVGALALGWRRVARRLSVFYFVRFDAIYLAAFAVAVLLCLLILNRIKQRTEPFTARVRRLKAFWNPWAGIRVATLLDGDVGLHLPDEARLGHVQIVGTTGRGKTESVIVPWIARDLERGRDAILIDGKGDPELVENLRAACAQMSQPPSVVAFDLGNPETSCTLNPLASGSAQQVTDRLFAALDFEEPFYKALQLNIAGSVIALIHEVDGDGLNRGVVTFKRLYALLTQDGELAKAVGQSRDVALRGKLMRHLALPAREREGQCLGLTSQLGPLAEGEVAPLVNGPVPGRECLNVSDVLLRKAADSATLFVVLLPTLKYQQIGHRLGKLILQELGWAIGERSSRVGREALFTPVYLDEFSAFVYLGFESILNKARSSRVAFHLSHQSNSDLSRVSDSFAEIIHTNTNVKCLLGLNDPDTADFFARHIGTETTEKMTERAKRQGLFGMAEGHEMSGDLSVREVEAFRIDPNELKEATHGRGVLCLPSRHGVVAERVQFERLSALDINRQTGGSIQW